MKLSPDPHVIEDRIRHRLAKRYNTPLEKRKLEIKGVPVEFEFVSQNEQIVGQIKSSGPSRKGKLKGEVRRQTQFGDFSRDCLLLAAKQAKTRLFVLTDRTVYREFCTHTNQRFNLRCSHQPTATTTNASPVSLLS